MTILYAARRPPFAVLGADQLFTGLAWAGEARAAFSGFHRKVHVHPRRALAFGTAGVAVLSEVPTDDVVLQVIDQAINMPLLGLGATLQMVLGMQLELQTQQEPEDVRAPNPPRVTVGVAEFVEGQASLLFVMAGAGGQQGLLQRGFVSPSPALEAFYSQGRFADDEGKFGSDDMSPTELVDHVRRAVQDGIDEEQRLLGNNRQAGGPVEVVLVDRDGPRFV